MKTETGNRLMLAFWGLLLLALCGWGVYWFTQNFERQERDIRRDAAPEARRNPLLAAERYLRARGYAVESLSGRSWLTQPPQEAGVLLVHHLGPSLAPAQEAAMLDWISRGGHLVVVARRVWDDDTPVTNTLLDQLGVRLHEVELPDDEEQSDTSLVYISPESEDAQGDDETLELAFRADRTLEDTAGDAVWALTGETGNVHLLEWPRGDGWITVLSDNELFTNEHIGEHDHAWFLGYLLADEQNIRLLYSSNMPSLLTLFWRHAPYLLASLTLLLILYIWYLTRRSGPLLVRHTRVRRDLMEHLHAAAGYAWRIDKAHSLFSASQARVEQDWRRRHPLLERLDREARCAWIAKKTGLDAGAVDAALYSRPDDEQTLIRLSALQQTLMKHLSRKSKG